MPMYVIQAGDTLWRISQRYRVPVERIAEANGLRDAARIVPGQSLVVPVPEQVAVRAGDTLWEISSRYELPLDQLIAVNRIDPRRPLRIGELLTVPRVGPGVETLGFYIPEGGEADRAALADILPRLTYLALFDYRATAAGELTPPAGGVEAAVATARAARTLPLGVLTNFDGNQFNTELAHTLLTDMAAQQRLIQRIVEQVTADGLGGIVVDFEHMRPADRPLFTAFIDRLAAAMRARGLRIGVAMAPKAWDDPEGPWTGAFDYAAVGRIVDMPILMTYEWGWVGGPPLAVAPLPQVRAVLEYASSLMPANKIFMGMPLYGYDWTLPYRRGTFARTLSPEDAVEQAIREGAAINWHRTWQSPFYRYVDARGRAHEVWFEDARSTAAKYRLLQELGLRGAAYWRLGFPFRQHWALVDQALKVVRAD